MTRRILLPSFLLILLVALLLPQVCLADPPAGRRDAEFKGAPVPPNPDAAPARLLVRFKPGREADGIARVARDPDLRVTNYRPIGRGGWRVVQLSAAPDLRVAVESFRKLSEVAYAEPDYRLAATQTIPNDPRFGELWALHNTGVGGAVADADIDAPEAWSVATASSIIVAVIDTGVDRTHADLAGRTWVNADEIPANGIDDDGNGRVDDVNGWDFAYGDNNPTDGDGHGTHVSGTIGAAGNNGIGVAGVCWDVRIMAVKFLDDTGSGYTSDAVSAIDYAVANGAKVLNNSWGGGGDSQALRQAIQRADAAGVLFVAAAGNNGTDNDLLSFYPAAYNYPNIISVAATTNRDLLASFSNYGATSVDLGAPGAGIVSTVPGNAYDSYSGTSMATPHVSGACALLWGMDPGLPHGIVKDYLLESVDPIPALSGKCVTGGRLNLANAVANLAGRALRLTSPNGSESFEQGCPVTVRWVAVGMDWLPADRVRLDVSYDNGATWNTLPGASALAYNAGSFAWTAAGGPSAQCRMRVAYTLDAGVSDASIAPFTLAGPLHHFVLSIASPQYDGFLLRGACTVIAADSDGYMIGSFGDFNTAGRFPVRLTSPTVAVLGLAGPGDELRPEDFHGGVADLAALNCVLDAATTPTTATVTASSADGKTGTSGSVLIQHADDYFTELFDASPFDLAYTSLVLVPDGSADYYAAQIVVGLTELPTDPSGGTAVVLGDDSNALVTLSGGAQARLYGIAYGSLYVGSNGFVTFGAGDNSYMESLAQHFAYPRVAALFDDLLPGPGQVSWKQLADRVAITWLDVPQYAEGDANTCQIELYYDGRIVISWLGVEAADGLAGLSAGTGLPADFVESDLSRHPPLSAATTTTLPPATTSTTTTTTTITTTTMTTTSTTTTSSATTTTTLAPVIIDNKDTDPTRRFFTVAGTWSTNNGGTLRWNPSDATANYRYVTSVTGAATRRAEWSCATQPAGLYEVFAWWPIFTYSMSHSVPYDILHSGGTTTRRVDQQINGGQWRSLGIYEFPAGALRVQVHNGQSAPGTYVVADAVKFVRYFGTTTSTTTTSTTSTTTASTTTTTLPGTVFIVDNKDAGATRRFELVTGSWSTNNGGTMRWNPSDTTANYRYVNSTLGAETRRARWIVTSAPAGTYDVYAWWAIFTYSMSHNVPYEVHHDGGVTTARKDQAAGGGQWQYLGTFTFSGPLVVEIHNGQSAPGTYVVADAVRFVRQ